MSISDSADSDFEMMDASDSDSDGFDQTPSCECKAPVAKGQQLKHRVDIAPERRFTHAQPEQPVALDSLMPPYAIADLCSGAAGGFSAAAKRLGMISKCQAEIDEECQTVHKATHGHQGVMHGDILRMVPSDIPRDCVIWSMSA